jgi:endonuclease-3
MKTLPKESWVAYNHQIIAHGRAICKAPTPKCSICFYTDICTYYKKQAKQGNKK